MCHVTVKWPNSSWCVWHESPAECVRLWCSRSVVQRRFHDCRIFFPFFSLLERGSKRNRCDKTLVNKSYYFTPTLKLKSGHWYPGLSSYTTVKKAEKISVSLGISHLGLKSYGRWNWRVLYGCHNNRRSFLANWCVESDVSAEWLVGLWRWVLLVLVFPEDVCYD